MVVRGVLQVENLLNQLETRFDEASNQILDRSTFADTNSFNNLLRGISIRIDAFSPPIPFIPCHVVSQMSSRVDNLENAIHDLINGDVARPTTPSTPGAGRD